MPTGLICMWSGLIINIPSGWALCNGQNGTPDLRDKFVKGTGSNPGATGGATNHGHAYSQVLNHVHPVNITDPGHVHDQMRMATTTGSLTGPTTAPDTSSSNPADWGNDTGSKVTGITASSSNPAGGAAQGTTADANVEPPYYALAFIMKT